MVCIPLIILLPDFINPRSVLFRGPAIKLQVLTLSVPRALVVFLRAMSEYTSMRSLAVSTLGRIRKLACLGTRMLRAIILGRTVVVTARFLLLPPVLLTILRLGLVSS